MSVVFIKTPMRAQLIVSYYWLSTLGLCHVRHLVYYPTELLLMCHAKLMQNVHVVSSVYKVRPDQA